MDKLEELTMLALGTDGVDVYARIKHRDMAQEEEIKLPTPGSKDPAWAKMGVVFGEPVEGDEKFFRHAKLPAGWKIVPTDHYMYSNLLDDKGRARASIGFKPAFYDRWTNISPTRRFSVERVYHPRKPAPSPKETKKGRKFVKYTQAEMEEQRDRAFSHVDMYGWHSNPGIMMSMDGYWEDVVEREYFPAPPCEDDTSVTYRVLDCGKEVFRSKTFPLTDSTIDSEKHYDDLERRKIPCALECEEWLDKQGFTDWKEVNAHWD